MQRSESIGKLCEALALAQGQIEGAKKDSANPHFKSRYADLASCWEACREALSKNGLAVVQAPGEAAEGMVEVTTMLTHKSGEWLSERLTIPLAKVDAQGYGSAVTYARRYALTAMVGIAPEDDDGNAAVAGKGADNTAPRTPAPKAEPIDWAEWERNILSLLDTAPNEDGIEQVKAENLATLKRAAAEQPALYQRIGKAFADARADVAKAPEKEAA